MADKAFTREQLDTAYDMLREATEAHIADEDNLALIRGKFDDLVHRAWGQGSFMVNLEVVVADALWSSANSRAGRTGFALLKEVDSGQTGMPHDEWLDQVVTVGNSRRTLVRHLIRSDLERMVQVRKDNHNKTGEALKIAMRAADKISAAIAIYGDIPTALDEDALGVAFAEAAPMADTG